MAVKYLKPGADFGPADFPSDFGFTGSARVGKAAGGGMPARPAPHMAPPAEKEPLVTMPMSQAIRTAHSLVQAGRQKGAQDAMGAHRPPMPAQAGPAMQGPPAPPPRPAAPPGPPQGALSQMPGAMPGMAKGGDFIAGKSKRKGK